MNFLLVIAESEVISLLGIKPEVSFVCGLAKNPGIVKALEKAAKMQLLLKIS